MMKRRPTSTWLKWCIEIGTLVEERALLVNHPHSLGEAWERGKIKDYDERIALLRANEPAKYHVHE